MTEAQRETIRDLRSKGYGYRYIAGFLGESLNTITSYCRRNNIKVNETAVPVEPASVCRYCCKPIHSIPGKKKRLFCSRECGLLWWKEHPEKRTPRKTYSFVCACCGKEFTDSRNRPRRFCSIACSSTYRFGDKRYETQ
ncbi:MAG: helix-turn-helix domain-containing protein [Oscillospiraceae bacterium]|nr:helix-turn-helix domain-containing protein [Oscillospiraceae bacterium]